MITVFNIVLCLNPAACFLDDDDDEDLEDDDDEDYEEEDEDDDEEDEDMDKGTSSNKKLQPDLPKGKMDEKMLGLF